MCGCQGEHAWLPGVVAAGGECVAAGGCMAARGHAWMPGGHAWMPGGVRGCRGACMDAGGMRGCRGACMDARGACHVTRTPPPWTDRHL